MGRKSVFPPKIHTDRNGYSRVFWKGDWHHLGRAGTEASQAKYLALILPGKDGAAITPPPSGTGQPLAVVCDLYLTEQGQRRKGKRELDNIKEVVRVLVRSFGTLPARSFRARHLEDLQTVLATGSWMTADERAARTKRKQPIGWCRNRVNLNIRRIRSLFKWAERRELVPGGTLSNLQSVPPLGDSDTLARDTAPRQPSTLADVLKATSHCPDPVAAMLLLQWWTGARDGEITIMRTMDLDCTGEVWHYKPGSELPYGRHKNTHRKQQRVVLIGPEAQRILRPWLRPDEPAAYLFDPRMVPKARNVKADHYSSGTYAKAVLRACKRAGVKVTPGQGRHAAKKRITRAMGLEAAAAVLGQKSLRTTEGYSREIDLDNAADAARRCG